MAGREAQPGNGVTLGDGRMVMSAISCTNFGLAEHTSANYRPIARWPPRLSRDLGRLAPEVASFDGAGALEAEIGEGGNRRIAAIRRFLIPMTGVPIHLA